MLELSFSNCSGQLELELGLSLAKVKTKEAIKETKKQEKNTKKIIDGIPEGVPKIGEVYSTIDKDERMAAESKREQKIHTETQI